MFLISREAQVLSFSSEKKLTLVRGIRYSVASRIFLLVNSITRVQGDVRWT